MIPPPAEWSESTFRRLNHVLAHYDLALRSAETARHLALEAEEQKLREAEIASSGLATLVQHIEQEVIEEANKVLEDRGLRIARVRHSPGQPQGTLHAPAPVSFQFLVEDGDGSRADPVLVFELAPGRRIRSRIQNVFLPTRRRGSQDDQGGLPDESAIPLNELEKMADEFVRKAFRLFIARRPAAGAPRQVARKPA